MKNEYIIRKTAPKKGLPEGSWVCFNKSVDEFKQIFANTPTLALINYVRWEKERQNITEMPCIECGKMVEVKINGLEMQGVFNVFCTGTDCEDKYAFKQ